MRTLLAGEFDLAVSDQVDVYVKLEVQNGSGTWIDVGGALGSHWIVNASWGERVDDRVATANFRLVQQVGTASLAPLMAASVLNVDDTMAYSPLLNIGRLVRASTATMARGVALDVSKYREIFFGRIDNVDPTDSDDKSGPIVLSCSDLGGWLMDLQVETAGVQYGTSPVGTALETVIQNILTANIPVGEPAVTLYKQSASNFAVTDFSLDESKLLDALTQLVLDTVGEDLRYRYDAAGASRLTWFNPDRARMSVDGTISENKYIMRRLGLELANIRNAGAMAWVNPTSGASGTVTSTDATSIAQYRRRFFRLPANSMLVSSVDAQTALDAVVNDLSEPPGEAEADCPYLWFVQLYDRYTFPANDRIFDSDQTFAVTGVQHTIENGVGRTVITCAARIVGAYADWLKRIAGGGLAIGLPVPTIRLVNDSPKNITVEFNGDASSDQLPLTWRYRIVGDSGYGPGWTTGVGTLPQQKGFSKSALRQASIELEVTQLNGKIATTSYVVQGGITGVIDGAVGRMGEDEARSGTGGVPTKFGKLRPDNLVTDDGTLPLIDTAARRFTTTISGPTGITSTVIERGGNKGDGGFTSTTGDLVSTAKDSRAAAVNGMFRFGTDGPSGVIESGIQAFVHPSYTDASRRPKLLRDQTLSADVDANDINVGQSRARGGFTNATGALNSTSVDSRASAVNSHFRGSVDTSDLIVDGTGSPLSGGRRGQVALNSSNLLVSGVHPSALGTDGYGNIESRRGAARQAGIASSGLTLEGLLRAGLAGVPVIGSQFITLPIYNAAGDQLIVDPHDVGALSSLRSLGTAKARAKMNIQGSPQVIGNNLLANLAFDIEEFDVGGLADTSSGHLTVPSDHTGVWLVHLCVRWAANATGYRYARIEDGSGQAVAEDGRAAAPTIETTQHLWVFVNDPAAGEWYRARVQQTSGGNLNASNGVPYTYFEIVHIW